MDDKADQRIRDLQERGTLYEAVLDHMQNGIMVTDPEGKIVFFSKTYGKFLGLEGKEHRRLTVGGEKLLLENLERAAPLTRIWLRIPLVAGVSDAPSHIGQAHRPPRQGPGGGEDLPPAPA